MSVASVMCATARGPNSTVNVLPPPMSILLDAAVAAATAVVGAAAAAAAAAAGLAVAVVVMVAVGAAVVVVVVAARVGSVGGRGGVGVGGVAAVATAAAAAVVAGVGRRATAARSAGLKSSSLANVLSAAKKVSTTFDRSVNLPLISFCCATHDFAAPAVLYFVVPTVITLWMV